MTPTGTARSGERRVVTALCCDVVGSTSTAETTGQEDWSDLVASAIDTTGRIVARYRGTVTEFEGDGILALFDTPIAHEDDPYRAVRAGPDAGAHLRPAEDPFEELGIRPDPVNQKGGM